MRNPNLNVFNLRECVSSFVDMFFDEIIHRSESASVAGEAQDQTLAIINAIKTTRWSVMEDAADVYKWYQEIVKTHGKFFSEFVERGYSFLMVHFVNEYAPDRVIELHTTSAVAFTSTFVACESMETKRPLDKLLGHEKWVDIITQYPWLMFVAILRNTYINMGDDSEQNPQGGPNER